MVATTTAHTTRTYQAATAQQEESERAVVLESALKKARVRSVSNIEKYLEDAGKAGF
jgi:hypothetical protein